MVIGNNEYIYHVVIGSNKTIPAVLIGSDRLIQLSITAEIHSNVVNMKL